jgi:hypothetical protein
MIILNQILQETVTHIRQINRLKCDFWAKAAHTSDDNILHNLFATISRDNRFGILEKHDVEAFLQLNSVRGKFTDCWFYGNSSNENYLVMTDFCNYMMKYIKISETMTPELEENTIEECLRSILNAEQKMFETLEPKKQSLMATFDHPTELFSFLKILFEDISSFSVRNHMKIMDFQKANTKLRLNHNFALLSASDISYLQNYFHLNCDSGISYEEFVFIFCDYLSMQTNLQSQMQENMMNVYSESFLPVNIIPASMRFNINNFKDNAEGASEERSLGLKALLLKGMTGKTNDMDAVYVRGQQGENSEMRNGAISQNSFIGGNKSVRSQIAEGNNRMDMSNFNKQKIENNVQGVVEVINERSSQQNSPLKPILKPISVNRSGLNQSEISRQQNQIGINQSGLNISEINGQVVQHSLNQSNLNLSTINRQTNQSEFNQQGNLSGMNRVLSQSELNRQKGTSGMNLKITNSNQNARGGELNGVRVDQLGINQSMHKSVNQSALNGLSQMSYPQINIHSQPDDIQPNSFMLLRDDSAPAIEQSHQMYRQNINGSILDDESDHLSQLDKTIRENILEFRY